MRMPNVWSKIQCSFLQVRADFIKLKFKSNPFLSQILLKLKNIEESSRNIFEVLQMLNGSFSIEQREVLDFLCSCEFTGSYKPFM